MNRNVKLEQAVERARREILKKHKLVRKHPYYALDPKVNTASKKSLHHGIRHWDYPTVVVACKDDNKTASGYSCEVKENSFNPILRKYLEGKLGAKLGGKSKIKGTGNIVGHCAENHAANNLMRKDKNFGDKENILKIEFSKALITRTGETIDYCNNCTTAYNVKN